MLDTGTVYQSMFLDRSPDLFAKVLQYLRTGTVYATSAVERTELEEEFRFFGLDGKDVKMPTQKVLTFTFRFSNNMEGTVTAEAKRLTGQGWRVIHLATFSSVEASGCTL